MLLLNKGEINITNSKIKLHYLRFLYYLKFLVTRHSAGPFMADKQDSSVVTKTGTVGRR